MGAETKENEKDQKTSNRQVKCKLQMESKDFEIPINIDNDNIINFSSNIELYTKKNKEIIESAIKIKSSELFDSDTIKKTLDSYTQFVPFDYQRENVETMLNVFEGCGCFGDQVGLGKTVETLMTAHVMFECGAIRNVLIISTAQTPKQWMDEINRKFSINGQCVFEVCNDMKHGNLVTAIDKVSKKIKKDNENAYSNNRNTSDKCRIYIASAYITGENVFSKSDARKSYVDYIKRGHESKEKEHFEELCEEEYKNFSKRTNGPEEFLLLNGFYYPAIYEDLCNDIFKESSPDCYSEDFKKQLRTKFHKRNALAFYRKKFSLCFLDIELCKSLLGLLLSKLKEFWADCVNGYIKRINIDDMHGICLDSKIKRTYEAMLGGQDFVTALFVTPPSDEEELFRRLFYKQLNNLDVKTINKFKSFVRAVNSVRDTIVRHSISIKNTNTKNDSVGRTEIESGDIGLLIIDEVHNFVSNTEDNGNVESFNAKCDYIYRTPSKYRIFLSATPIRKSLDDAADLACFAKKDRYGRDFEAQKDYYYDVICGINTKGDRNCALGIMTKKGEVNRINGIINSTFTRSRIVDEAVKKSMTRHKEDVNVVINYVNKLKENEADFSKNLLNSIRVQYYIGECIYFKANDLDINACKSFEEFLDELSNDIDICSADRLFQAFDIGAMNFLAVNEKPLESTQINTLYELIDWTRAGREKIERDIYNINDVVDDITEILNSKEVCGRSVVFAAGENDRRAIKERLGKEKITTERLNIEYSDNKCELLTKIQDELSKVYIPDSGGVVGTNLTDANTLILMSLDASKRIAEPLDIEQWIGRIYRTGQKRDCKIFVYPRSNNKQWKDKHDLLKFYLDVLSDKDGLDLFGEGKAEVGFVAPIVVDYLHLVREKYLLSNKNMHKNKKVASQKDADMELRSAKHKGTSAESSKSKPTFAGFVKLVFDGELCLNGESGVNNDGNKEAFKDIVRKICKMVAENIAVKIGKTEGDPNA